MEVNSPNTNETPFTPEGLGWLFFLTYRYSQGNQELQCDIFRYIHAIHPEWKIPISDGENDDRIQEIHDAAFRHILRFLSPSIQAATTNTNATYAHSLNQFPGKPLTKDGIADESMDQLIQMIQIFNSGIPLFPSVAQVAKGIIERDYDFLSEDGRPRQFGREGMEKSPIHDPWNSHFIYWGILGNNAGAPELTRMFQDVVRYATNPPHNSRTINYDQLDEIIRIYNDPNHHPGANIQFPHP